jgi:hypothetical protein
MCCTTTSNSVVQARLASFCRKCSVSALPAFKRSGWLRWKVTYANGHSQCAPDLAAPIEMLSFLPCFPFLPSIHPSTSTHIPLPQLPSSAECESSPPHQRAGVQFTSCLICIPQSIEVVASLVCKLLAGLLRGKGTSLLAGHRHPSSLQQIRNYKTFYLIVHSAMRHTLLRQRRALLLLVVVTCCGEERMMFVLCFAAVCSNWDIHHS